jgi:replicative DNA helicase
MSQTENKRTPRTYALSDLVGDFVADTDAAAEAMRTGRPRGAITGLAAIDKIIGGHLAVGVHVLQGAPGCGKTALALQIASRCAYPALYVSIEMGLLELFRRLIARETETFLGRLKTGEISGMQARNLALATVEKLPALAFMDATNAYAEPSLVLDNAKALRERMNVGHSLVVIDSLQTWARSVRTTDGAAQASEYDAINDALHAATQIATRLNAPVLLISHRNRVGNKEQSAALHSSKGSGDIEYVTETMIDLTPTKQDAQENADGEMEVTAKIVKNRHGVVGVSTRLFFSGRLQSFREV